MRSRIANRVSCTSAFSSSVASTCEEDSDELLDVLRTPRNPCTAASIGAVIYISTSSADAPGQLALIVILGNSTSVFVASARRVNAMAPDTMTATAAAQTTAGRFTDQRI